MDGTNRLLGGKVASFDMRSANRYYFRKRDNTIEDPEAATSKGAE